MLAQRIETFPLEGGKMLEMPRTSSEEGTQWELGPFDPSLPGPLKFALDLDGEIIEGVRFNRGYSHRGVERLFEELPWVSHLPLTDRIDSESASSYELAYCLAAEELLRITPPARAVWIRQVLEELTRIACSLSFLAKMANSVGASTAVHFILRDRETLLDLFELLTGQRFTFHFLCLGGVKGDVTDGFMERVLQACEKISIRIKEYNDLH